MPLYESTFIVRPDLSAQDTDKIADEFAALVKEKKGKVVKKEYWGIRSLAYRLDKHRRGHYFMLGIDANGDVVKEIERRCRFSEDVVRNLTVKVEAISEQKSAVLNTDDDDNKYQSNRG